MFEALRFSPVDFSRFTPVAPVPFMEPDSSMQAMAAASMSSSLA